MARDLYVSDAGVLQDEHGRTAGLSVRELTVTGGVTLTSTGQVVKTQHDALYALKPDMESNGTSVPENAQDVGLPRWSLAAAVTQRCKWTWPIPVGWSLGALRWGWDNESAGAGNVKWQFSYRLIFLGETDVDAGAMTDITIPAIVAGGQFDFIYSLPNETQAISLPLGGFGDSPFMLASLSRIGGSDTLAGAVAVSVASLTRVT